jgi:hypothetical protein
MDDESISLELPSDKVRIQLFLLMKCQDVLARQNISLMEAKTPTEKSQPPPTR